MTSLSSTPTTERDDQAAVASAIDFEKYGTIYFPRNVPTATSIAGPPETLNQAYPLRGHIGDPAHPAQANRYHLYASLACPFAQRSLITRALKGLDDVIGLSIVDPLRDGRGWAFREVPGSTLDGGGRGFTLLREAYDASVNGTYTHRISVPVLWDTATASIVSNYYPDIPRTLNSAFTEWATHPEVDLYPEPLAKDIADTERWVSSTINQGVYKAGFATTQDAYDRAAARFFESLDRVESILADNPYLVGDQLTGADINLWVTLIRFEPVYHHHFKLTKRSLRDYPHIAEYTKRLHQIDAFHRTTDIGHITQHYYGTQLHLNPRGIVPLDIDLSWLVN